MTLRGLWAGASPGSPAHLVRNQERLSKQHSPEKGGTVRFAEKAVRHFRGWDHGDREAEALGPGG